MPSRPLVALKYLVCSVTYIICIVHRPTVTDIVCWPIRLHNVTYGLYCLYFAHCRVFCYFNVTGTSESGVGFVRHVADVLTSCAAASLVCVARAHACVATQWR